ncbi:hypothetical protein CMEL01_10625, partial [Colletotrichum melonis]
INPISKGVSVTQHRRYPRIFIKHCTERNVVNRQHGSENKQISAKHLETYLKMSQHNNGETDSHTSNDRQDGRDPSRCDGQAHLAEDDPTPRELMRAPQLSQIGLETTTMKCLVCGKARPWTGAKFLTCSTRCRNQLLKRADEPQMENEGGKDLETSAPYTTSNGKPREHYRAPKNWVPTEDDMKVYSISHDGTKDTLEDRAKY